MKIDDDIAQTAAYVLDAFRKLELKIATVESCTGGLIAASLTAIAGSSDVFERGFVTYSNNAKTELVGVPKEMIDEQGAVSSQVAIAMALGGLSKSQANVCVSVTGIAGPGGATDTKSVGLVYVAVANADGVFVEELNLGDIGRDAVRKETVIAALEMLVAFGIDTDDEPDYLN